MTRLGRIGLLLVVSSVSYTLHAQDASNTDPESEISVNIDAPVAPEAETSAMAEPAPAAEAAAIAPTPEQIQAQKHADELALIRQKSLAWVDEVSAQLRDCDINSNLLSCITG